MPVYPKESLEYRQKILKSFYKQVQETNWSTDEERICKPRGRKPQARVVVERPLQSKTEYKQFKQTKFFNFH
jgi:hypothetical protein